MNIQPHNYPTTSGRLSQPHWYAVYTHPKAEKKVYNRLREMGLEAYLPLQQVVRQWSDRKKKMEAPLFPNYVFVKTSAVRRYDVCRIPELVRFVTCDNQPVVIPEKNINDIRRLLTGEVEVYENASHYKTGERVKVVHGQFAGTEGVLVKVNGKKRLVVQLEVLRKVIAVDISTHCVMPLA